MMDYMTIDDIKIFIASDESRTLDLKESKVKDNGEKEKETE